MDALNSLVRTVMGSFLLLSNLNSIKISSLPLKVSKSMLKYIKNTANRWVPSFHSILIGTFTRDFKTLAKISMHVHGFTSTSMFI